MSYKNIVFVKLEKRLLNDPRWWTMSEPAQLIYIKLILLAAETYNKLPKNDNVLRQALRSRLELSDFINCLKEIKNNFPKLKENKHFRYFNEFETKTNYIPKREIPRKSQGHPKLAAEEEEDKEEDKDKYKSKKDNIYNNSIALWAAYSQDIQDLLKKVFDSKLNIYALINRFHKMKPAYDIPEKVMKEICLNYLSNKDRVKKPWPWFISVMARELEKYFVEEQDKKHDEIKKQGSVMSIADILALASKGEGKYISSTGYEIPCDCRITK